MKCDFSFKQTAGWSPEVQINTFKQEREWRTKFCRIDITLQIIISYINSSKSKTPTPTHTHTHTCILCAGMCAHSEILYYINSSGTIRIIHFLDGWMNLKHYNSLPASSSLQNFSGMWYHLVQWTHLNNTASHTSSQWFLLNLSYVCKRKA